MYDLPASKTDMCLLIGVTTLMVGFLLVSACVSFFQDFSTELKYLNNEIRRTDGAERRYWIKRKRKLWLSLIPFVKY